MAEIKGLAYYPCPEGDDGKSELAESSSSGVFNLMTKAIKSGGRLYFYKDDNSPPFMSMHIDIRRKTAVLKEE